MEGNQSHFENVLYPEHLIGVFQSLFGWMNQHVLNLDNFTQAVIIGAGLFITFVSAKKINKKLAELEPFESIRI